MMNQEKATVVLMVDDEHDFLDSVAKGLARRGLVVLKAFDGHEALEVLKSEPVDVVVLDVKMPGIDGYNLFYEVHARLPHLPVIMLTGHGTYKMAFEMSKHGIFDYLAKPCDVDELATKIHEAHTAAETVQVNEDTESGIEPVTVLVIDDEKDFLMSIQKVLARRGMKVLCADSGRKGIDLLSDQAVDVAVVDIRMPGLDGLEVMERIRTVKPGLEVILLTGHATVRTAIEGLQRGAFAYLLKPQDIDELVSKINQAASKKREADRTTIKRKIRRIVESNPS